MGTRTRSMSPLCGGIDVGGTKIASAIFAPDGAMTARERIAIDSAGGDAAAAQVADRIASLDAAARSSGGRLAAVGICVPGIAYPESGRVWAPNIPGWDQYPLLDKIRGHVRQGADSEKRPSEARRSDSEPRFWDISVESVGRLPLLIESDRSAYVAGEAWRGSAAGAKDVVFLAVGTGIGAGIISGGRLVRGHEAIAGAVGWFGLDPDFKADYATMGCFEAEASGASIARKARAELAKGRSSSMSGAIEPVTAAVVAEAARAGDALAREIVSGAVTYLAMGVANIVSVLNPETVVLGGGVFQAADLFLEPVRREFRRWAQPLAARAVRIELSTLGEDAGLYGCGKLAWEALGEGKAGGHVPEVRVPFKEK